MGGGVPASLSVILGVTLFADAGVGLVALEGSRLALLSSRPEIATSNLSAFVYKKNKKQASQ